MVVMEGIQIMDVMKYGALSANTVTEEAIDMVLYNSFPEQVRQAGCVHGQIARARYARL